MSEIKPALNAAHVVATLLSVCSLVGFWWVLMPNWDEAWATWFSGSWTWHTWLFFWLMANQGSQIALLVIERRLPPEDTP